MVAFKTAMSIVALIAVVVTLYIVYLNQSLSSFIWIVSGSLALFVKIVERLIIMRRYHDASVRIDTLLSIFDTLGKNKAIPEIQNAINTRRRLPVVHINLFHKIKAVAYHFLYRNSNQCNK